MRNLHFLAILKPICLKNVLKRCVYNCGPGHVLNNLSYKHLINKFCLWIVYINELSIGSNHFIMILSIRSTGFIVCRLSKQLNISMNSECIMHMLFWVLFSSLLLHGIRDSYVYLTDIYCNSFLLNYDGDYLINFMISTPLSTWQLYWYLLLLFYSLH